MTGGPACFAISAAMISFEKRSGGTAEVAWAGDVVRRRLFASDGMESRCYLCA